MWRGSTHLPTVPQAVSPRIKKDRSFNDNRLQDIKQEKQP